MIVKMLKKSEYFAKHGKHKGVLQAVLGQQRQRLKRPNPEMFGSVQELFNRNRRKR